MRRERGRLLGSAVGLGWLAAAAKAFEEALLAAPAQGGTSLFAACDALRSALKKSGVPLDGRALLCRQ